MTKFPSEKTQPPQQEIPTAQVLRQAQFEAFFAAANAGMMILDRQLRYVEINEAMAELNGIVWQTILVGCSVKYCQNWLRLWNQCCKKFSIRASQFSTMK